MQQLIRTPFSTAHYKTVAERSRARLLNGLIITILIIFSIFTFYTLSNLFVPSNGQAFRIGTIGWVMLISVYGLGVLTIVLNRTGRQNWSALGLLVLVFMGTVFPGIPSGMSYAPSGATLIFFVMMGGLLLQERGIVLTTIVAEVILAFSIFYQRQFMASPPLDNSVSTFVTFTLAILGAALCLGLFLRLFQIGQNEKVNKAARGRQELANLTAQIAQRVSRHFNLNDLLDSTIQDILKTYPEIYHVQIFLTDADANEARLAAGTGEVGKTLLRRKHSIPMGSRSVIGQVTVTGQPIIALVGGADSVHKRNESLPDTAAEAAFPMRLGSTVIGALDLQSRQHDAFEDADNLTIFQSLADSIAIAVDNARLFEQTENRIQENQRLIDQMRNTMREVERLNSELTERAWSTYLAYKGEALGVTVDLESNIVRQSAELTGSLDSAMREGRIVQSQNRDQNVISAPLRVRGQVIGAMEFEIGEAGLTSEDIELVNGVAERFSLALESARLYEESRRVAQRETTLNQIGARLQTTNTVDALLAETARGLQASLGANRVAIRLGSPPKTNGVEGR